jgi:DNA-directed RNA polymerase subunit H (RpoH/RPB5)
MNSLINPMTEEELNLLDELNEIYPVVKTQNEMLYDRGYIPTKNINVTNKQIFVNTYYPIIADSKTEDLYSYFSQVYYPTEELKVKEPTRRSIYVYYYNPINHIDKTQIGQASIVEFTTSKLETENKNAINTSLGRINPIYDAIFISKIKLSLAVQKFNLLPVYKNTFTYSQLNYNITRHKANSKFKILSNNEKKEFLRDNRIPDETKMPGIFHNDPMCLYYGAKIGNIVQLTRPNLYHQSLLEESISYRLVIQNVARTKAKQYTNAGSNDRIAEEGETTDVFAELDAGNNEEIGAEEDVDVLNEEI